jgi:tetratricopeptide (TPR) repeat protein
MRSRRGIPTRSTCRRTSTRGSVTGRESCAGERGEYVWDEFPHAIEYLIYAYLQQGADAPAANELRRLQETPRLEPTIKTAFHLASTRARFALERQQWDEAARIVPREPATLDWDRFAWPEAVGHFARGLGALHGGDPAAARSAIGRLEELDAAMTKAGEMLFARSIRVLRLELAAWLAHTGGAKDESIALMREAVALESSTPKHALTPGPTLPAPELLGDLLIEQGRPADALASYRLSLAAYPRRFNSLLGAARAARASNDDVTARRYYGELLAVASSGSPRPGIAEAREFLGRR